MANSLKSQLFEIYMGRKKYSPLCTYINYTLKRCIKKNNVRFLFHAKVYLSERLNYRYVFGLSVLRYLNL